MNDPIEPQEPNAIYWLEMRLACRSCLPQVFAFLGSVMGLFLIAVGLNGPNNDMFVSTFWFAIPMGFWAAGPIAIPFLLLRNFADQLRDGDDLMLRTAMTGSEILRGKLRFALVLLLYLYAPTLPGNLLCLLTMGSFAPLSCGAGFVGTLCLCAIGLGFLAGGKTIVQQQILLFLALTFAFFTAVMSYAAMEPVHGFFYRRSFLHLDYQTAMILTILTMFLIWTLSAALVYAMGVMILSRSRRLFDVLLIAVIIFLSVEAVQVSFLSVVTNPSEQVLPYIFFWTLYALPPILTLGMAVFRQ